MQPQTKPAVPAWNVQPASRAARKRASHTISFPPALRAFVWAALGCTLLSFLVAGIQTVRHNAQIAFSGFWPPLPGFDFSAYLSRFPYRHSTAFFTTPGFPWFYPAAAIFLYAPFYGLASMLHASGGVFFLYLVAVFVVSAFLLLWLRKQLILRSLTPRLASLYCLTLVPVSWPLYVACQRGNVECFVWAATATGVWAIRGRRDLLAVLLLGFAASVKIYPGLFLALYFVLPGRRRWIAAGLLVAVCTSMVALFYLDPHVRESWLFVSSGIRAWTEHFAASYPNHPYDHSIFAQLHLLLGLGEAHIKHTLEIYYVCAAAIATTLAWLVSKRPFSNQVLFLSCAAITLPPVSFDYTLCMIYLPFALLSLEAVSAERSGVRMRGLPLCLALIGVVVAPSMFALGMSVRWPPSTVKCVALLMLIALSAVVPFDNSTQRSQRPALPQ